MATAPTLGNNTPSSNSLHIDFSSIFEYSISVKCNRISLKGQDTCLFFICDLFNGIMTSNHVALSGRMVSEKEVAVTYLRYPGETQGNHGKPQDSRSLSRGMKPEPPKYETGAISI
jgi:hypothetical protein